MPQASQGAEVAIRETSSTRRSRIRKKTKQVKRACWVSAASIRQAAKRGPARQPMFVRRKERKDNRQLSRYNRPTMAILRTARARQALAVVGRLQAAEVAVRRHRRR